MTAVTDQQRDNPNSDAPLLHRAGKLLLMKSTCASWCCCCMATERVDPPITALLPWLAWACADSSQQWSAKAVIIGPKQEDLLPMQKVSVQAAALGARGLPAGKALCEELCAGVQCLRETIRDHLKTSPLFAEQVKTLWTTRRRRSAAGCVIGASW